MFILPYFFICKTELFPSTFFERSASLYFNPPDRSTRTMDEKMKRKSDKYTKQSFALLQKLKQRKEKKEAQVPAQQNFIDDLYLKVFGKCSPHFNKMQTSNEMLKYVKEREKACKEKDTENEYLKKECRELKDQVGRLKESEGDVGRIKTLNQQISILEGKNGGLNQEIRELKKVNENQLAELQRAKEGWSSIKVQNEELQEIVKELSKELQNLAEKEPVASQQSDSLKEISGELDRAVKQIQMAENQIDRLNVEKGEMVGRIQKMEKERQTLIKQLKEKEINYQGKIEELQSQVKSQELKSKNLNEQLQTLKKDKSSKNTQIEDDFELMKKDLQTVVDELTNLKVEKEKNQSQSAEQLLKHQNQAFQYLEMIRELNKNSQVREAQQRKQFQNLNEQIKNLQEKHKGELQKKEQLFQKVFTAKSSLEKSAKTKQAQVNQLTSEISALKKQIKALKGKVDSQTSPEKYVENNNSEQIAQLEQKVSILQEENQELKIQLSKMPKQEEIEIDLDQKIEQYNNEKIKKNMEIITELNNQLTQAYEMIKELEGKGKESQHPSRKSKLSQQSPPKERQRSMKKIAGMFGF